MKIIFTAVLFFFLFLKLSVGQIEFQKTYNSGLYSSGYYVAQTTDSGFIMTGTAHFTGVSSNDAAIFFY